MILRRAVLLLGLTLSFLPGCGRTFIYERADAGDPSAFVLTGKRFAYLPISNSYRAQQEVKRLPAGQFSEARNWALGCWRFKTSDGFEAEAFDSAFVDYIDDRLIVTLPREETITDDQGRVRLDYADIRELISRQSFPVEIDKKIFWTKQVMREGSELIVVLASGEQKRIHGDGARIPAPRVTPSYKEKPFGWDGFGRCVRYRGQPYDPAPIYAIDGKGLAYSFLRGCDDVELSDSLSSGESHTYVDERNVLKAVPMRTVERWEFDKEWGPTLILWRALRGGLTILSTNANDAYCRWP